MDITTGIRQRPASTNYVSNVTASFRNYCLLTNSGCSCVFQGRVPCVYMIAADGIIIPGILITGLLPLVAVMKTITGAVRVIVTAAGAMTGVMKVGVMIMMTVMKKTAVTGTATAMVMGTIKGKGADRPVSGTIMMRL